MAVNAVQSALSSRRFNKWFPWIAAAVLVAGAVAFSIAYFGNTAKTESAEPTGPPVAFETPQKNIPFPDAAWSVTKKFIFTAVARKQLAASYAIANPSLRQGFTLKQWEQGTIPVPFYPVAKIQKFNWRNTNYAHPRDAQINVILLPKAGSGQRPNYFQVGLKKIGSGAGARWTVDYFGAINGPPIPTH
jgi:hypothetical protein